MCPDLGGSKSASGSLLQHLPRPSALGSALLHGTSASETASPTRRSGAVSLGATRAAATRQPDATEPHQSEAATCSPGRRWPADGPRCYARRQPTAGAPTCADSTGSAGTGSGADPLQSLHNDAAAAHTGSSVPPVAGSSRAEAAEDPGAGAATGTAPGASSSGSDAGSPARRAGVVSPV